jgi:Domain of unknown function (DUF4270)
VGLGFLCHIFKPTKVRTTIFYLLPALGALLLSACQDSLELGVNLVDEDRTQVQVVDTLRVESSSLLIDSMYTGNGPRMLVGEYEDPYFGKVSSQTYFDVDTLGNFKIDDDDNLRYDSLVIYLRQDYEYPQNVREARFSVYTLAESLDDETIFFNDSPALKTAEKIGDIAFTLRFSRNKKIGYRLDDALGRSLFNLAKQKEGLELENVLKGLSFVPTAGQGNTGIIGFATDDLQVRLFYHDRTTEAEGAILLRLRPTQRFNRIQSDRKGLPLEGLQQVSKPLAARLSKEQTYIQAGVGIGTLIEFPTLRSIRQNRLISVQAAYLDIQPLKESFQGSDFSPLENIQVYVPSHKNTLKLPYWFGSDLNPTTARREVDPLTGNSSYRIYLTDYVSNITRQDVEEYDGIILYAPASTVGINELGRLVLPSQRRSRASVKLHVVFSVIQ